MGSQMSSLAQAAEQRTEGSSFTLFPKLPVELRLMVWELALPGPRVITIQARRVSSAARGLPHLTADYSIPAIFHTSQESREAVLRKYEFAFPRNHLINSFYFDFSRDVLFLRDIHTRVFRIESKFRQPVTLSQQITSCDACRVRTSLCFG